MDDISSEIDAFFAGATTWDFVIMGIVLLVMYKMIKKLFFLGILLGGAYYLFEVYGK
jgi:hypothetical protein